MLPYCAYWRRAAGRALKGTLDFLGFTVRSRLIGAAFSYVLALLFFLWVAGRQQMVGELQWGIAATGALVLIFTPLFLANLIAAPVLMERDANRERTHLREILHAKNTHREIQEMHAALTREGANLAGEILTASDLALEREKVNDWRSRVIAFLDDHVDPTQAVNFEVYLKRSDSSFQYEGRHYSGDKAVLASQVDHGQNFLGGVYIPENPYYDYLREQWEAELKGH